MSESIAGLEGDDIAAVSADCRPAGGLIACRLSESLEGLGVGLVLPRSREDRPLDGEGTNGRWEEEKEVRGGMLGMTRGELENEARLLRPWAELGLEFG